MTTRNITKRAECHTSGRAAPRNYRLSWAKTLVGLLTIDDERFVFATPSGVTFNVPRSESTLEWRRGKGFGMIPRFDLSTPAGSFRLYLSRPSTSAPLYSETIAAKAGEQLSAAGDALSALFDGGALPLVGVVGNIMSARADFREQRQGRASARALRARISSPPRAHPSAQ